MKSVLTGAALLALSAMPAMASDFTSFTLSTVANASPEKAWAKIGGFCAIHDWLGTSCVHHRQWRCGHACARSMTAQVTEMMVAKTPFSYTYIQPINYAEPLSRHLGGRARWRRPEQDRLHLPLGPEPLGDADAKAKARQGRTDRFNQALAKMKSMAETP